MTLHKLTLAGPHRHRGDTLTLDGGEAALCVAVLWSMDPAKRGDPPLTIACPDPPCRSAECGGVLQHAPGDWPWSCPECGRIYTRAELGNNLRADGWEPDPEHLEAAPADLPPHVRTLAGADVRDLAADYRHAAAAHLRIAARLAELGERAAAVAASAPAAVSAEAAKTEAAAAAPAAPHRLHADALTAYADRLEAEADVLEAHP